MLRSAARHGIDRAHDVVVFDLGLTDGDRRVLAEDFAWCRVEPFLFDRHPAHVRDLPRYAWKPIAVADVVDSRGGLVLWLDSATLFHGPLDPIFAIVERHGVFALAGQTTLGGSCAPGTLARLRVPDGDLVKPYRASGALGFDAARPDIRTLVTAWRDCALDRETISPAGHDRRTHKFDQAIITALLCRAEREYHLVLGNREIDISSINPVPWISTRNKVPSWMPLALDPAVRGYYALWKAADRVVIRARRDGAWRRAADVAEHHLQAALDRLFLIRAGRRARRWLRDAASLRGRRCHCPALMETHLVHSEALREGCDIVVDFGSNVEQPARPQAPVPMLAAVAGGIAAGDAIHVKADLLQSFVESVLPHIGQPFVLVTGDSDVAPVRRFAHLLDDARLLHWFAQNCDLEGDHPRLTRIPIGIDNPIYTKLDKRLGFLAAMLMGRIPFDPTATRNGMGDQVLLRRVRSSATRRFAEKPARALCTFHRNSVLWGNAEAIPDRREACEQLRDQPACHFVTRRMPQRQYWEAHDAFAFEVAPRGNGLDSFRTWECLFLDTVPIVKTSALDALYRQEKLPVVIVESWREVTPANLRRWQADMADPFTGDVRHKLTADYWLGRIHSAAHQGSVSTPRNVVSTRVLALSASLTTHRTA